MDTDFAILKATRDNFLNLISGLDIDQLNKIPVNFNNNIAWHLGHIVVARQLLCYQLSGLETGLNDDLINRYKKGSKPEAFISQDEVNMFKGLCVSLDAKMAEDFRAGIFKTYNEYTTSFGVKLASIEDAVKFNVVHEGLHLGYVMALKRAI